MGLVTKARDIIFFWNGCKFGECQNRRDPMIQTKHYPSFLLYWRMPVYGNQTQDFSVMRQPCFLIVCRVAQPSTPQTLQHCFELCKGLDTRGNQDPARPPKNISGQARHCLKRSKTIVDRDREIETERQRQKEGDEGRGRQKMAEGQRKTETEGQKQMDGEKGLLSSLSTSSKVWMNILFKDPRQLFLHPSNLTFAATENLQPLFFILPSMNFFLAWLMVKCFDITEVVGSNLSSSSLT